MTPRRKRLEAIGRAILEGRPDTIQVRETGRTTIDPDKHLLIDSMRLNNRDFSARNLDSFRAITSRFLRCSFRDVRIRDACWGVGKARSEYIECCFDGARFRSVAPGNARFVKCSFRGVRIYELYGFHLEFENCVFSGRIDKGFLNFRRDRSQISWFARKTNKIVGNDFSACDLRGFAFRTGIDLEKQKLPIGPNYLYLPNAALAAEKGKIALSSWQNNETRRLAGILLSVIENDVKAGQTQQLFSVDDSGKFALPWQRLRETLLEFIPSPETGEG